MVFIKEYVAVSGFLYNRMIWYNKNTTLMGLKAGYVRFDGRNPGSVFHPINNRTYMDHQNLSLLT